MFWRWSHITYDTWQEFYTACKLSCFVIVWHRSILFTPFSVTCRAFMALRRRHNGRDSVSKHQPHDCFLTNYSDADQRNHQSSASLAFVRGIHRVPAQMASNAENVSIWWRHHGYRLIMPVPVKQPWTLRIDETITKYIITKTRQRTPTCPFIWFYLIFLFIYLFIHFFFFFFLGGGVCCVTHFIPCNDSSLIRCQAITWTDIGISSIESLWTSPSEIWFKIQHAKFKRMDFQMSSDDFLIFCGGITVLCPIEILNPRDYLLALGSWLHMQMLKVIIVINCSVKVTAHFIQNNDPLKQHGHHVHKVTV